MPNSESESEFTASTTFFCLGALLGLGAVSEDGFPFLAATVLLGTLSICFRPNDGEKTEAESSSLLSNLAESSSDF